MQLDEETGFWFDQGVQTIYSFTDAHSRCSYSMQAVIESDNQEEEEKESWRLVTKIILNDRSRLLKESSDGFITKIQDERVPESIKMFDDATRLYVQLERSKRRVRRMLSYLDLHLVASEFLTERLALNATHLADLAMKRECATLIVVVKVDVVTSLLMRDEEGSMVKRETLLQGKATELDEERQSKSKCDCVTSCAVCFEEVWGPAALASLPCSHTFHRECIMHWFGEQQTCPLCRFEIPLLHHNLQGVS